MDVAPPTAPTTAKRILRAGMRCFAREGFAGATTRMIAGEAGVTLPVIAYHFENKDGLHRACANDIVEGYRRLMQPLVSAAREAAESGALTPTEAREWIDKILAALVSAITADEEQRLASDFVMREMSEQGPGFALLYDELWQPGLVLVGDLVAFARSRAPGNEEDRASALMLVASLSAFTRELPVSLGILGWQGLTDAHRRTISGIAARMVDGMLAR